MAGRSPIVLAAGGTGGHVFPALAVAEELVRRGYPVALATDSRGMGVGSVPEAVQVRRLSISSFGGGIPGKVRGGLSLALATAQSWQLLRTTGAAAVVGFGGYPSVPAMTAAIVRRLPCMIHEQNAFLGLANRLLAPHATAVALSFEQTSGLRPQHRSKAVVTGNPVRAAFGHARKSPYLPPAEGSINLLVLGGSQGARAFSEVVPEALAALPAAMRRRLAVAQQCRKEDLAAVRSRYDEIGLRAELAAFFDDVPRRMADSQLVITRSGASTIAELAEAGRPAILVPYPHAAGDHQTANAEAVERMGGGWHMPSNMFTADGLAGQLSRLLERPPALADAARAMHGTGGRNSARALANHLEAMLGNGAATETCGEMAT